MNFLSLFIWIWIKFNFPLESPIAYFFISLINSSRETYLSWTKKNRDVSSGKILHVELRPSFIYIKSHLYILKLKEGQELNLAKHRILPLPKENSVH